MRWRFLALLSLGVNLALLAVWLFAPRHPLPGELTTSTVTADASSNNAKSNIVLRRQFFSWQEVESSDYPTYIANLRNIGCPEQTIRDIIIADVNALYARKRALELITPAQQWWRSEPDTNVLRVALEKSRALDDERRALLTSLLGPTWEAGDLVNLPRPSHPGVLLDGPVLGSLPADTKQAIEDINARSETRMQNYLDSVRQQGKSPDSAELAKLRQQTRDELARVLAPAQLEEFLLRYSQDANNLRTEFSQLRYFNPTADEFRAIFRATDSVDQQLSALSDSSDPSTVQARQALEAQRNNAIKIALGPDRYQEYQMLHDPLYRQAVATAQAAGTPDAAQTIYQINLASASTQDAINANTNLSSDQKAIELKQLELDQLKANSLAMGRSLPPEPPPPQPLRRTYTLQPGDSPAVVGMIYGIPESAIRAANPNIDFNRLRPGDSINIPRSGLNPTGAPLIPAGGP
ncbi:MAG TPA: LysM domain-containing protein [Verrucomicrobiae bacterium]|nr:LysM domain-containing protein [Verrucomicrobiae bacterium]